MWLSSGRVDQFKSEGWLIFRTHMAKYASEYSGAEDKTIFIKTQPLPRVYLVQTLASSFLSKNTLGYLKC